MPKHLIRVALIAVLVNTYATSPPVEMQSLDAQGHHVDMYPTVSHLEGEPLLSAYIPDYTRWLPPLSRGIVVNRPFSMPNGPYLPGHRGIDIAAKTGEIVVAPFDGVVTFAGVVVDRPTLTISDNSEVSFSVEPVESGLRIGDQVSAGMPVGFVSSGGHCSQGCIHAGVRVSGEYVNPLRWFRAQPLLLP